MNGTLSFYLDQYTQHILLVFFIGIMFCLVIAISLAVDGHFDDIYDNYHSSKKIISPQSDSREKQTNPSEY